MAMPASYRPSPLGYGSPRSSPFRRPESPSSPSPLRQTTPSASPSKGPRTTGPSRLDNVTPTSAESNWTPKGRMQVEDMESPRRTTATVASPGTKPLAHGNALSQLQPSQVRTLRDGFQILDRDSDSIVGRDDVADMLGQLGLPSSVADVAPFFPPSAPQTMSLAVFLNSLAARLAALSASSELLNAFSAFDDDDSGQVDLAELRDALLNTVPEAGEKALTEAEVDKVVDGFRGRRAFSKSKPGGFGKKGEVFKYQEFVHSVIGGNGASEQGSNEGSDET